MYADFQYVKESGVRIADEVIHHQRQEIEYMREQLHIQVTSPDRLQILASKTNYSYCLPVA